MNSVLITGCNRGLGLGLVRCFVRNRQEAPKFLLATVRNAEKAEELQQLAKEHPNIHILEIDLKNFDEYDNFARKVGDIVKENGLNVLLNNAGYSPKSTRLPHTQRKDLLDCFEVNSVVPVMLTKALLPLLQKAASANVDRAIGPQRACVVNMSTLLGSIAANDSGGLYAYRMSKAALNMATKSMSRDMKGDNIMAVCLHPGWVRTDMGGSRAPLDVEESTSSMERLIRGLSAEHNGKFLQYDGKELEW
ncbi:C-signal [Phlebotomus argentipes]|uniref:C-signal n=1 Tax=Phlebotomus argentipes TaxID=94469 RepID=UPI002892B408|nr:C-signal [Phlebotomus argentipes]